MLKRFLNRYKYIYFLLEFGLLISLIHPEHSSFLCRALKYLTIPHPPWRQCGHWQRKDGGLNALQWTRQCHRGNVGPPMWLKRKKAILSHHMFHTNTIDVSCTWKHLFEVVFVGPRKNNFLFHHSDLKTGLIDNSNITVYILHCRYFIYKEGNRN